MTSNNLLFVKIGALGDVIQAAAALKLFRDTHPEISVDWVVDSGLAALVEQFNVVDQVIAVDTNALFAGSAISRVYCLLTKILELAKLGGYDTICCAHPDWRFGLLTSFVRAKHRVSPKKLARSHGFISIRNRVFEYYRLLTGVDRGLLSIDAALRTLGNAVLAFEEEHQFDVPARYVVLMPGGARNALRDDPLRRWAIESYVELAQKILDQGDSVVLLGGPGDRWVSEHFSSLEIIDFVGQTSLTDMVRLLDKARCAVTHDSGPIHLASITQVPLVGIFGPTPANAVLSFSRGKTIILQPENHVSCSPCYDGRGYAVCGDNICMQATTVDQVLLRINQLIVRFPKKIL